MEIATIKRRLKMYDPTESECDILLFVNDEMVTSFGKELASLGFNLSVNSSTLIYSASRLMESLVECHPKILLYMNTDGNPDLLGAAAKIFEEGARNAAKFGGLLHAKFRDLFGNAMRIVSEKSDMCDREMPDYVTSFVWADHKSKPPLEDEMVKMALLTDGKIAIKTLRRKVWPACNSKRREKLIILALQARSGNEAKRDAMNFTGDESLAQSCRWIHKLWAEHRDIFPGIVFPGHDRIPLVQAIGDDKADEVEEMLNQVKDPIEYDRYGNPLIAIAVGQIEETYSGNRLKDPRFRVLQSLLKHGFNASAHWECNVEEDVTPLRFARKYIKDEAVIGELVKYHAEE